MGGLLSFARMRTSSPEGGNGGESAEGRFPAGTSDVRIAASSGGFCDGRPLFRRAPLGTWAETEALFADALKAGPIEFRDESGSFLALTGRTVEPICPWEPTLTVEEIDRRSAQGGTSLAEFWKRMGVE